MRYLLLILLFLICLKSVAQYDFKNGYDPLLFSFIEVESKWMPDTINALGYVGILQIGHVMIEEVNRICRIKKIDKYYVINDALDVRKSVEIWYLVQRYWNPKYQFRKAIKVWNPTASKKYRVKLEKAFENVVIENYFNN